MTSLNDTGFAQLRQMLEPRSVAVLGASERAGNFGGATVRHLIDFGFPGKVWVINRTGEPVAGVKAYTDVADLPEVPDLVVFAIPAVGLVEAIARCAEKGVRYGVAYAGGFAEGGAEGHKRQQELVDVCNRTGFLLCGPNCVGFINLSLPVVASFATALHGVDKLEAGSISMISQSGGIGTATMTLLRQAGVSLRMLVSSGNEAVVNFADYLGTFVEDEKTRIIAGYLEGVRDGDRFVAALRAAREKNKPVVLIKAGMTAASSMAAGAHTGAIVGEDSVFDAILKEFGVIRVHSLSEMVETLLLLSSTSGKLPEERGVGILTFGGGSGVLATDQSVLAGLSVPPLAAEVRDRMKPSLLEVASASNPVDLTPSTAFQPEALAKLPAVIDALASQPDIGTLLFACGALPSKAAEISTIMVEAGRRLEKPICLSWTFKPQIADDTLRAAGMHAFEEPARALNALGRIWKSKSILAERTTGAEQDFFDVDLERFTPSDSSRRVVTEDLCHGLLRQVGLPVAPGALAKSADEAVRLAADMAAGVALKGISSAVPHRAAAGLLAVGLHSEAEVRQAHDKISARAAQIGADLEGIYVQQMQPGGSELLVSAFRDPVFGPMISVGAGGGLTEIINDTISVRGPVSAEFAERLLGELRISGKLKGQAHAARFVSTFSHLATHFPWENYVFEINPILCSDDGVTAVDGLLIIDKPSAV